MRAALYHRFRDPLAVEHVPDPAPPPDGVVLRVMATGLCRSDWHGWMGHDSEITLPHVPGHEMAGIVAAVGKEVTRWRPGDRVTVPFICACGRCPQCASGNQQVCDAQFQPGFTRWGSFAEYVALPRADVNLVHLPEEMPFATAASLGCRVGTAFRAVVEQGGAAAGQWVAVHGCGGVGLSAILIARAVGAHVIAVDIRPEALELARHCGAQQCVDGSEEDVVEAVRAHSGGGAHLSLDALGHPTTCFNSIAGLRKRGRHVQVGLLLAEQRHPPLPMDLVVANELEIVGSHGMQAHRYPDLLAMIAAGTLHPEMLLGRTLSLDEAAAALPNMDRFEERGVAVITRF